MWTSQDKFLAMIKPEYVETCVAVMVNLVPFWLALSVGLMVGWIWQPKWVSLFLLGLRNRPRLVWSTPPGFGARRFWLAVTALSAYPILRSAWGSFRTWMWPRATDREQLNSSSAALVVTPEVPVTNEDLRDFIKLLEGTDGGASWQLMMDRSTSGMAYQAWRREPLNDGPTEYRSRTVLEDVTPELMRDFFWDDEFRPQWDDMIIHSKTWEECPVTGSMIVQWVRKYPFFCKDREYIIGRRVWEWENMYYCVQKSVPYPSVPRRNSPRRVDTMYSSFRIRAVESRRGDGQLTACEVMLFHHEDMGIQKDIAKLGVRQGMWGCVKKIEPGAHKYQAARKLGEPLSNSALMARINTKISVNEGRELGLAVIEEENPIEDELPKPYQGSALKWAILGGAVVLACGVDRGAVGKVLVFGLARRLGRIGRRL